MASSALVRFYGHAPTIAAAVTAAMATAAATSGADSNLVPMTGTSALRYSASIHHSFQLKEDSIPKSQYLNPSSIWQITIKPLSPPMIPFPQQIPSHKVVATWQDEIGHRFRSWLPISYNSLLRSSLQGSHIAQAAAISSAMRDLHVWHLSDGATLGFGGDGGSNSGDGSFRVDDDISTCVVLLGWLGSKQKHLKRYVEWYNNHGLDAVSFVLPMGDIVSLQSKIGSKAEAQVDDLVKQLEDWLGLSESVKTASVEENLPGKKKTLVFHTFSNTGWLVYGAVLKRLIDRHGKQTVDDVIRGCVVDSAPVLESKPEVWASGFSTALLKKQKPNGPIRAQHQGDIRREVSMAGAADIEEALGLTPEGLQALPGHGESALKAVLEKLFSVVLKLPAVKQKLSEITDVLASDQPSCPQLYIYSLADDVIPSSDVESFVALQKTKGKKVMTHRFVESPHVDHFRTFPEIYTSQLQRFMKECLPVKESKAVAS